MENFGIIIHYGLYSYYGYDDIKSAKKRKIQNGSEWYYGRLIDNNKFRPISGQSYTKIYHSNYHQDCDYFDNLNQILTDKEKIKQWVDICKTSGATYIILTSKHHDGICLWDTNTTNRKSKLNICKIFSDECVNKNIKFGFYYSWFEFDKPFTVKYFNEYCVPQLNELCKYNPNYIWFDGHWKITQKNIKINEILTTIKQQGIIINDRVKNFILGDDDFRVYSDRFIPENKLNVKWQHVNTIGYSWGYNKTQKDEHYKNDKEIMQIYREVTNKGGHLLLNLGPMINGDIQKNELETLINIGLTTPK